MAGGDGGEGALIEIRWQEEPRKRSIKVQQKPSPGGPHEEQLFVAIRVLVFTLRKERRRERIVNK